MNLFQRLKIWKELKRLELRAREQPSPSTFVDLGQVYINLGMCDRTLAIAEEGLALFPDSSELRKLRKFSKKTQLTKRIEELRTRLNRSPEAALYRELAGLYLEMGDFGAVHGTCEECVRRFPDDAGIYLVLARARLTSFYRDLSSREGLEAVRCLERVLDLEGDNVKARRLLVDLLHRIGAFRPALQHLAMLERMLPGEQELHALRQQLASGPGEGDDIEVLFHNVEAVGRLPHVPVSRERHVKPRTGEEGIGRIRDSLAQIAEMSGVRKAAYIKGGKALVKGEIRDGRDGFLRVVRIAAKAGRRYARRLDVGSFNKGVMDGSFGCICVCSFGEVVAAVQTDERGMVDRLLAELQELVAGSLFTSGGTTR